MAEGKKIDAEQAAKVPDAVRRRVVLSIKIGADSWDEAIGAVNQIALDLTMRKIEAHRARAQMGSVHTVSGGPSRGWTVIGDEDPEVTHDTYFEGVDRQLGRTDRAGR